MDDAAEAVFPGGEGRCLRCLRCLCFLGVAAILLVLSGCQSANSIGGSGTILNNSLAVPVYPPWGLQPGPIIDPFKPFVWKPGSSATAYFLQVGTTLGGSDVFTVGSLPPNVTSWPVDNLLPGKIYYAKLSTQSGGAWNSVDVAFGAASQPQPSDRASFYSTIEQLTSQIRLSAGQYNNLPTPGSPLAKETALRGRTYADCTDYAYTLVGELQKQHIYARRVVLTQVGGWLLGHTLVEYYDPFLTKWSVADATFGVVYFDDATQQGQSAMELSQYVFSESWSFIHPKFVTPNGDMYMTGDYLDPIAYFLNVLVQGSLPQQSLVHDPKQFLVPVTLSSANPHGSYIFEFGNSSESMEIINPEGPYNTLQSGPLTLVPFDAVVWSNIFTFNDGWSVTSAPPDVQAYTFRRVMF